MKSTEVNVPTQSFLLPGQEFCVGLPWERASLPKHGLPPAPPPPPPKGNALDESQLEADPFAGVEIGPCEVIRRLSLGSVKSLLALRTDSSDQSTALVVLKQLDIAEDAIGDLKSHAQWMNYLQHVNLARVFPCEVSDEGIFWVSEFASGATLAEISAACRKIGKAVPHGLSLAIAHEAALALGALHAPPGVPHGFVHPESLCVTFEGGAKLLELGMFRCIGTRLLRPQALHDMAPYLAPEQVERGQMPDTRTDVFALAATLYEALSGQKLGSRFDSKSAFVAPSSLNHALSKELDLVMLKALDPDRSKRFGSAMELAKALKSAASVFMWKPSQRADFVGDLFRTRRRREKVLLAGAEELITRKRSSLVAIPQLPPPPPPEALVVEPPPATVSMRATPPPPPLVQPKTKAKPRTHTRPLALALVAVALGFAWQKDLPLADLALAQFAPVPADDPAYLAALAMKPKPPPPAPAEPKTEAAPSETAVAAADDKPATAKHAKPHHAQHKGDALPPWLQPRRHGR